MISSQNTADSFKYLKFPLFKIKRMVRWLASVVAKYLVISLDRIGLPINSYLFTGVPIKVKSIIVTRGLPKEFDNSVESVRPHKFFGLDAESPVIYAKFLQRQNKLTVPGTVVVENGYADNKGLVLSNHGEIINEKDLDQEVFLNDWDHYSLTPNPVGIKASVAAITHRFQWNYFHWLFDIVPKIAVLNNSQISTKFFYASQALPFQRDSLKLLGIDSKKVISTDKYARIHADTMIAVTHWDAFSNIPQWVCKYLRENMCNNNYAHGRERIYISRSDSNGRCVLNEHALIKMLARYDFKSIVLSKLSLQQQIRLFSSAEIVIGPHGAGLSNIVFCRPRTKIVELSAPRYIFGCWYDLASKCNLEYIFIGADNIDLHTDHGWEYKREDFTVDLVKVEKTIYGLIKQTVNNNHV